jgi:hypothetical protein
MHMDVLNSLVVRFLKMVCNELHIAHCDFKLNVKDLQSVFQVIISNIENITWPIMNLVKEVLPHEACT